MYQKETKYTTAQLLQMTYHSQHKSYKMIIEKTFPAVFQNLSSKPESPWTKKWLPAQSGKETLNAHFFPIDLMQWKI